MFRTNRPATAEAFHDRVDEIARVRGIVDDLVRGNPRWLAIVGPRKVGKTSLILELERRCSDDVDFVVLDVEHQRPLSWEIFRTYALRSADRLLGSSLGSSLEVASVMGDVYVDRLLSCDQVRKLPSDTLRVLRSLPEHEMDPVFIRQCLDLPERLAVALDRHVVVAIDEFQQLSTDWSAKQSDPLPVLRSSWQTHQRVAYIVSGSGRTMLEEMVTEKHSPFFQHFALMSLDRFSEHDAAELLVEGSPKDRPIPPETAAMAVEKLGGNPFYLQLLGEELTSCDPPLDEQALKDAVQRLLFVRHGRLALYFERIFDQLVGKSTFLAAVLGSLSGSPRRVSDIAAQLRIRTGDAARYLKRLGDAVVKDDDGAYRLEDATFALWLSWRKPGGTVVPMTLLGDEAEKEVATRLAHMGFELVYQSRASRGTFDLLAVRGPDQLGVQVKRSAIPLRFPKTAWNRMEADATRLGWRWIIAAVDSDGSVTFHDPAKARRGREVRVTDESMVHNLAQWVASRP